MIAFTFSGQGSQRPGMGRPWAGHESWELVADVAHAAGRDLEHLLLDADADELTRTRNAQLATFTLSLVVLDAVERLGVEPALLAGHSLGEYTALVAAGCLDLADGARLVAERGEAMQVASDEAPGAMAAVLGLDDDQVDIACVRAATDVWVANYNGPGQVVVAGTREGVDAAAAIARDLGAKRVLPLPVGGAFHTPLMSPARDRLKKALTEVVLRDPDAAVVANVDAVAHAAARDWPGLLLAQLCSPVRWRQSLTTMVDAGVSTTVELGPGTVLTGLAKRAVPGVRALAVGSPDDLDTLLDELEGHPPSHPVTEGEHLFMVERVVVSPAAGVFSPAGDIGPGRRITVGDRLGDVAGEAVRSPFEGTVMGVIALDGERVTNRQPIAWLRTA